MPYLLDNYVCASSSWDFWKTPKISFSLTAVPTLQPVFMLGRIQDFGNGGPISVNSSYLLGDLPPNYKFSLQKNTQNTQENASNLPPPQICGFLRALTQPRRNVFSTK